MFIFVNLFKFWQISSHGYFFIGIYFTISKSSFLAKQKILAKRCKHFLVNNSGYTLRSKLCTVFRHSNLKHYIFLLMSILWPYLRSHLPFTTKLKIWIFFSVRENTVHILKINYITQFRRYPMQSIRSCWNSKIFQVTPKTFSLDFVKSYIVF